MSNHIDNELGAKVKMVSFSFKDMLQLGPLLPGNVKY